MFKVFGLGYQRQLSPDRLPVFSFLPDSVNKPHLILHICNPVCRMTDCSSWPTNPRSVVLGISLICWWAMVWGAREELSKKWYVPLLCPACYDFTSARECCLCKQRLSSSQKSLKISYATFCTDSPSHSLLLWNTHTLHFILTQLLFSSAKLFLVIF